MTQVWLKAAKMPLVCVVLILFQIFISRHISMRETSWVELPIVGQKRDPRIVQIASFGNLMALVDWLFITCLADQTMTKAQFLEHSSLYFDLDLLTDLDPAFFEAYFLAGNILPLVQSDGGGAKKLLLKSESFMKEELPQYPPEFKNAYWQDPWKLYVLIAYNALFHLDDITAASIAFQQAAAFPGVPEYLIRLDKRLKVPGGEYEVGLKLLNFLIQTAPSEGVKVKLEKKKSNLFIAQYVHDLNLSFMNYLKVQPHYISNHSVSEQQMQRYWRDFVRNNQIQTNDPWGGKVSLNRNGKVVTSTFYESAFGLK